MQSHKLLIVRSISQIDDEMIDNAFYFTLEYAYEGRFCTNHALSKGGDMREQQPMSQTMKISDVRSQLNTLVNRVYRKETRVVVEKSGIPVAGIVSTEDLRRLDRLDEQDQQAWAVLDAMRAPFKDVPPEEIEREAERAVAEVRSEMRAEREQRAAE